MLKLWLGTGPLKWFPAWPVGGATVTKKSIPTAWEKYDSWLFYSPSNLARRRIPTALSQCWRIVCLKPQSFYYRGGRKTLVLACLYFFQANHRASRAYRRWVRPCTRKSLENEPLQKAPNAPFQHIRWRTGHPNLYVGASFRAVGRHMSLFFSPDSDTDTWALDTAYRHQHCV